MFLIFSGGMPRASHGVRHTVSVLRGSQDHVVFDVTSKVVDFLVLCNSSKRESLLGNVLWDKQMKALVCKVCLGGV